MLLIAGVIVLSLGDLVVTVAHLKSTGMVEANPIADFLIRHTGSVAILSLYKAMTVALCVGLLYRLRHHFEGELAAWCATLILSLACLHWYQYAAAIDTWSGPQLARQAQHSDDWLVLD